jgi:hypothetical protein
MSVRSIAAKNVILRMTGVMTVAGAILVGGVTNESFAHAQSPKTAAQPTAPPRVRLPDESAGIDGIARTLIAAFDQVDIVALGEAHGRKLDSDLRIAVVRHPDFARKVRSIVVEFGSVTEQSTLDRYIRGEDLPIAQLERVWGTTAQFQFRPAGEVDGQFYIALFSAVRDFNSKLPADARIRVFGGDPGPGDHRSRETTAVSVLKEEVLQKHGKALVIYGAAHFYRTLPKDYLSTMGADIGIARMLEIDYPGRTFVVIPVGGRLDLPPAVAAAVVHPDYDKFDRALNTRVRPVLVPLQRLPFRNFTVEEFLGSTVMTCRGAGGCRSVFQGNTLTLGQMADACFYVGSGADVDTRATSQLNRDDSQNAAAFSNIASASCKSSNSLNGSCFWRNSSRRGPALGP